MAFLEKIFGSYSKKELARIEPIKQKVLDLESKYADMPTKELQAQTAVLKGRLKNGETLDDILPDAFAVCREAAWRTIGQNACRNDAGIFKRLDGKRRAYRHRQRISGAVSVRMDGEDL